VRNYEAKVNLIGEEGAQKKRHNFPAAQEGWRRVREKAPYDWDLEARKKKKTIRGERREEQIHQDSAFLAIRNERSA